MTLDDIVAKVTDPYDRQARLYPALLCLLPLLALVALLYAPNVSALTGVATLAVSCGGLFLMLMSAARSERGLRTGSTGNGEESQRRSCSVIATASSIR